MLARRSAEWARVRATLIARAPTEGVAQTFRLPWHAFRLGLSGRFAPGSTQRLDGGPPRALTGGPDRAAFYPAGTVIANAVTGASRLTYLMVEIDREAGALSPVIDLADRLCLALLDGLRQALDHPADTDRLFAESAAMTLLLAIARLDGAPPPRAVGALSSARLARVTDHIAERLAEPVGLDELAAVAGLSPSHLCRAFRRSTGLSPHRWQMRARIGRAKELLLDGELPLAAIAAATGFSDQSHLTTAFRRAEGLPPAAWRRAARA